MFVGGIDQASVGRILNFLTTTTRTGSPPVHLAIQSIGGSVSDGIALYEAFRSLPIDLTVYNLGGVSSIATIAFLGARKRKATPQAAFMLHQTTRTFSQAVTALQVREAERSLSFDDQRMEEIVSRHLRLTPEHLEIHRTRDLWFSAQEALTVGIIDEIASFTPPRGAQVWNI